nr:MAG TPA: hypothetical protein [Caudoviricetes sp.]
MNRGRNKKIQLAQTMYKLDFLLCYARGIFIL